MTVKAFETKYREIQNESIVLHEELKPLFKKLKALSKKAQKLAFKITGDNSDLYVGEYNAPVTNGWNPTVEFRLQDFDYVDKAVESLDTVLYNINHTKFKKKK